MERQNASARAKRKAKEVKRVATLVRGCCCLILARVVVADCWHHHACVSPMCVSVAHDRFRVSVPTHVTHV